LTLNQRVQGPCAPTNRIKCLRHRAANGRLLVSALCPKSTWWVGDIGRPFRARCERLFTFGPRGKAFMVEPENEQALPRRAVEEVTPSSARPCWKRIPGWASTGASSDGMAARPRAPCPSGMQRPIPRQTQVAKHFARCAPVPTRSCIGAWTGSRPGAGAHSRRPRPPDRPPPMTFAAR
jgi:hypothetical protein